MENPEFGHRRSELDIISEGGDKFYRCDQRMTLLYRLHDLPQRRVKGWKFVDQDLVLNVTIGDTYVLGQHAEDDPRNDHDCYFGHFGSTVDDKDVGNDDYTDDRDQIKSLALFGDCYSKYVDPVGHCQVERDKSGLWIKDLGSEYGTFVNGVKLNVNVFRVLKSGDLISLGFSYQVDQSFVLQMGQYWVFKVYEVPISEFEHRKSVATAAMETSEILDTILSNLNYKELKLCRFVCQLWDEEARRKLSSRTRLVFPSSDPNNYRNYSPDESERLTQTGFSSEDELWIENAYIKLSDLQNTGIWSISFWYNISNLEFPIDRLPFFKNIFANTKFRSVELDFSAESENVTSLFKSILSWSQLQEVTFNRRLFQEGHGFEHDFGASATVQKLMFYERQPGNYSQILKFFPKTTEIFLSSSAIIKGFLNENYGNQLNGLRELKMTNYTKKSGVNDGDEHQATEICKMLPLICALSESMQLTRFELRSLDLLDCDLNAGCECVQGLFHILSKFKNSLEHFELGLSLQRDSLIQFPEMKKLSFFSLCIKETMRSTSQIFASGFGIENFPRLESLEMFITGLGETQLKEFVEGHFGSQSEFRNNSVRTLTFMFPNEKMEDKYSQLAKNNFREIFPNCVNFYFFCESYDDEDL